MSSVTQEVLELLRAAYGATARPRKTLEPFAAAVAAILAQQGAGTKMQLALDNLREDNALNPDSMLALASEELEALIRPAGHAAAKSRRLRSLCKYIVEQREGSCEDLLAQSRTSLIEELREINGIGPETADSVALHAAGLPVLPIEACTHRIWKRHGWAELEADYFALQEGIESGLPAEVELFAELQALLARVGSDYCRTQPKCEGCPLAPLLPNGGAIDPTTQA